MQLVQAVRVMQELLDDNVFRSDDSVQVLCSLGVAMKRVVGAEREAEQGPVIPLIEPFGQATEPFA